MSTGVSAIDYDTQLMLGVRENDDVSFALLVERHRTPLVQHLARMVQNPAVAEELAQDVFLRIHRSRRNWEPSAKFTTWLFRISTNVAYNHFRDERHHNRNISLDRELPQSRRQDIPDRLGTVEQMLVGGVRAQRVRDAIENLPFKQRTAVLLHKYEELDYAQISVVLGCTQSAVKALMFRAYESLRMSLADLA